MNIENIIQILKSEIEYEKNTIKQNREHLSIRLDVLNDYLNGKNASGYVMDIEDTSRKIVKSLERIKEKNNIISKLEQCLKD
ncbi:hypothetical protein E0L01_05735 [Megamonas funiformis]|uniref:hypothetical protein n=1 Tax=Megamonas funiformis TaxID=437897 RepID=UPI001431DBEB|nr:hypothetical protein [Megamonas funiformis]NJE28268.1 hypothetical protein [Megamonas funiformis]